MKTFKVGRYAFLLIFYCTFKVLKLHFLALLHLLEISLILWTSVTAICDAQHVTFLFTT